MIANGTYGVSMSGGDRILIEMTRRWIGLCKRIHLYVNEEGYLLYKSHGIIDVDYVIWPSGAFKRLGFMSVYIARICVGALKVLTLKLEKGSLVYSASDFLPDSIPALILKLRHGKNIRWIAGFYLFAPNPFDKDCPYKRWNRLRGVTYYLSQWPIYLLVNNLADAVCVTSEPDVKNFITKKRSALDVTVMRGGVDFKFFESVPEARKKEFDAVYIGRLHPQKGILELMDIWKLVAERKPGARLAVIGDGPLEKEAKNKSEKYNLYKQIEFFGFKDGAEKAAIFKSSRIVVHPATYDSGGMAPCEAMACGLPGVAFDLVSLRTYYPKGMLKVPCFDKEIFAKNIDRLLEDGALYNNLSRDAKEWAKTWDWDSRAEDIFYRITALSKENR